MWCNRIISNYYDETDDGFEWYAPFSFNGNKNQSGFYTYATGNQKIGSDISLNEWHILALVFNVTSLASPYPPFPNPPFGNVTVKSYIDCKLDTEVTTQFKVPLNWYFY